MPVLSLVAVTGEISPSLFDKGGFIQVLGYTALLPCAVFNVS